MNLKRKEKKQAKKELRDSLYRPRSRTERAAVRRARTQAAATVLLCLVLIAGAILAFIVYRSKTPPPEETGESTTPTESEYTVLIDPGHGGSDAGSATDDETSEADYTMILAKEVGEQLTYAGCKVVYTRESDLEGILPDADRIASAAGADCMISLHTCDEEGAYYSLLSDTTALSALFAGYFGEAIPENEYTITTPVGVPCVRLNCTLDTDAEFIAQGVTGFLEKYCK